MSHQFHTATFSENMSKNVKRGECATIFRPSQGIKEGISPMLRVQLNGSRHLKNMYQNQIRFKIYRCLVPIFNVFHAK